MKKVVYSVIARMGTIVLKKKTRRIVQARRRRNSNYTSGDQIIIELQVATGNSKNRM